MSKENLNPQTIDEIERIEEEEKKIDRSKMKVEFFQGQLEQSKQWSNNIKYNSFGYYTNKLSKRINDVLLENISSDLNETDNTDIKLITPIEKEQDLKY